MKETLARGFQNDDIDRINSAVDDFASVQSYLHPLPIDHDRLSLIVSTEGYDRIDCLLNSSDGSIIQLYNESLIAGAAASQVGATILEVKFLSADDERKRSDDRRVMDHVRSSGRRSHKGLKKVKLEIEPIKPNEFLPAELEKELIANRAKPYYEKPSLPSIAWVDRSHDPKVMAERQKEISAFLFERVPFLILDPITTVKV